MRILMFTDYFFPHVGGGVEKVVLEISIRLVKLGHEVCVLTLNTTNAKKEEYLHGIRIVRIKAFDLTKIIGLQSAISLNLWYKAKDLVNDFKPDVIHLHNRFFFTTLVGLFLKKKLQIPTIVTIHLGEINYITGLKGAIIRKIEKYMIKNINKNSEIITAVSNNVMENVVKLGVEREKCVVIPNGVDLEFFKMDHQFREKPRKIVYVGRLLANKGPQILLQSAKSVIKKFPDVQFLIVGDGPLLAKLEKFCNENNLNSNVKLLGRLEDIRPTMNESDLYVRPSYLDGMPLGVLEAMAMGLPVLATDIAGTKELIEHGKTGHLVRAGNADELANAIIELLQNPDYMKKIANNGLEFISSKFDWDHVTQEYEKCYRLR